MFSDLANDAAFKMVTTLQPAECTARLKAAIDQKVWIVSGEPRWESNYVTGKITADTLLLRNHTAWCDSPTFATATIQRAEDGTIIAGMISYDLSSRRWMRIYRVLAVLLGLVGVAIILHLLYVGLAGPSSAKDLLHRPFQNELGCLVAVGYIGFMGYMPLVKHRGESKALRRFLIKLFEVREELATGVASS